MSELSQAVNRQIANWSVMFIKLHNYHWYVTGPEFFTLHAKFEELYNEAALHIDELAERLLAMGDKPVATMAGALEQSSVKEAEGRETAQKMVATIVEDYSTMIQELKQGMELADAANDETTGDLLLSIQSGLEKHVWMLNSFLGR
ncbi:DNA starvation/stationary phase protection protein [Mesobacillus subterraneus]|uniref:Dps family protein n=1 Tax=Mesobacillus subterraneus TaxID=285983 RepID=UPI00203E7B08|nr:Dps family protein [Mesobacillus subterraneus]MCM3664012.1 DNA starvation/stationary phase protection protein [Mesobacillus subterraneus]MCM3685504.1 DNA starvation/stationary phase protection protein [Mesobacillus subterraneus]